MSLKNRINQAMQSAGINASELARRINVSRAAVSLWRNGTTNTLTGDNLIKVAQVLKVSPFWLATGEGLSTQAFTSNDSATQEENQGMVPWITWKQAAEWRGKNKVHSGGRFFHCPVEHGHNTFVIQIQDKAMYGIDLSFSENDLIFVDPSKKAGHGNFVVARLAEENAVFRKLIIDNEHKMLLSLNQSWPVVQQKLPDNNAIVGVAIFRGTLL